MPPAKVKKIPPTTLALVEHATRERGWDRIDHGDEPALVYARGWQTLRLSRDRLRSSTFSMREFGIELDMFDKARR